MIPPATVGASDVEECNKSRIPTVRIVTYRQGWARIGGVETVPFAVNAELELPNAKGSVYFNGTATTAELRRQLLSAAHSLRPM